MAGSLITNATTAQAFYPLRLPDWLLIASNDIPAIAVASGNGGKLAVDTAPKLIRASTSTDKALTITWAATSVIEITHQFFYPPDLDATKAYTVNLRAKMGGVSDTPTIAVGCFEGIGDTNRGGNTAAVTGTSVATYSVTITPSAGHPNMAAITLTPAAHGTDTLVLVEAYILYSRQLLSS